MLKTEEQEIDGLKVTTTQFPAMYAFRLLARLARSVGPVMGAFQGASPDTDLADLAPQLSSALSVLDPDEVDKLVLEVLKCTSVWSPDGSRKVELSDRAKIDEVFSGRIMTMFKVLGFCLKVNFSDFVTGIGQFAKAAP